MKNFTKAEKEWLNYVGKRVKGEDFPTYEISFFFVELKVIRKETQYQVKAKQFLVSANGYGQTAREAVARALTNLQILLQGMIQNVDKIDKKIQRAYLLSSDSKID